MSLPGRERRALKGIEAGICSSDPGLVSMMAIFSKLAAGADMPAHERGPTSAARFCTGLLAVLMAVTHGIARVSRTVEAVLSAPSPSARPYGTPGDWRASPASRVSWYWYR